MSVAPVFLLAGIAGMLNVLSSRLGRVVDRARAVEKQLSAGLQAQQTGTLKSEAEGLWKRVRLVNWSIRMFVCAALLVCLVIATLFLAELMQFDVSSLISAQFIGSMGLMILGLVLFLVEVTISTALIRDGIFKILEEKL